MNGSTDSNIKNSAQNEHEGNVDEKLITIEQLNQAFDSFFRSCYGYEKNYWLSIDVLDESEIRIVEESELSLIPNREKRILIELYNLMDMGCGIAGRYETNVISDKPRGTPYNPLYNDEMLRSLCATKPNEGDYLSAMKNAILTTLDKIDAVMYEVPDKLLESLNLYWTDYVPILIYFHGLEDHWAIMYMGWTD